MRRDSRYDRYSLPYEFIIKCYRDYASRGENLEALLTAFGGHEIIRFPAELELHGIR